MNDWPSAPIEGVAEKVAMGPFGSSIKVATFVPDGIPIISGQHLRGYRVDDRPGFNYISPEHAERLSNSNVVRGDVVFTHAGNIGQVSYIPENSEYERYVISQRQFYMRCDTTKIIPEFLTLYFKSREGQHQLLANTSQVGVPSIAQPVSYLRTIAVPVPPLDEQRRIAHILGTLDDKIELNRRMNETLEEMARAIFKDWFVDFGPVRAKMEGREAYLPEEIWRLFPDRLVDSELGEVPEGWGVKRLGEVCEINPRRSLKKGAVAPYLAMSNMPTKGHSPVNVVDRPFGSGMRYKNGDTLVARITPCLENGKTAYVDFLNDGQIGWGSTEYIVMRPDPPIPTWFAYCLARGGDFRDFAVHNMSGTSGRQRVSGDAISSYRLAVPVELGIPEAFGRLVEQLFVQAFQNSRQSRTLVDHRDAMLPRLVSGKVKTQDTDKMVKHE